MFHLIVVRPFGSYRIGDVVDTEEAIATILASEHSANVVRIAPPVEE